MNLVAQASRLRVCRASRSAMVFAARRRWNSQPGTAALQVHGPDSRPTLGGWAYALRLRTAGTNISFTYMRPMPVPPASVTNALPRVPTVCAWEQGVERITELKEHWDGLWVANKAVGKAYGLSKDDFRHILASFPVFAKKHAEFFASLVGRLDNEAW